MTGMTRVWERAGQAASGAPSPSFAARALGNRRSRACPADLRPAARPAEGGPAACGLRSMPPGGRSRRPGSTEPALSGPGGLLPAGGGRLADQRLGQLVSPGDIELAVRTAEVRRGGLRRDEQLLSYLTVALARRRQPGDAQLAGGQGVAAGDRVAPRFGAGRDELRS